MKSPFHSGDNGVFKSALEDNCPLFGMVCPVENTVYIQYIQRGGERCDRVPVLSDKNLIDFKNYL